MTTATLSQNIKDVYWRLNNLYWCVNEQGRRVKFRMNDAQKGLFETLWWRTVISKARQMGFTTFTTILALDFALFNDDKTVGFIAHKQDAATKIYQTKILYPLDNMPSSVLKGRETIQRQTLEVAF